MLVHYMSDLHLEFGEPLETKGGDVLILAGDITTKTRVEWINEQAKKYDHVLYVAGNHEYYQGHMEDTDVATRMKLVSNVTFLQNDRVEINGRGFIGGTLWSNIHPEARHHAEQCMNDYLCILNEDNRLLRAYDTVSKFLETVEYLEENIQEGDVVITHHAPSYKSIPKEFMYSMLNSCYASNLKDLILQTKPAYWIHGHMHEPVNYKIGGCKVRSNPRGYPKESSREFKATKRLKL